MYPTRQLWAALLLTGFLAVLAVVTANLLLLGGAGLVGAWVLVHQYQFTQTLETTVDSLEVRQSVARSGIRTNDTVPVTLTATLETDSPFTVEIEGGLPTAAASDDQLSLTLEPGDSSATRTVDVSWPIAGRHQFAEPTVTVSNELISETLSLGEASTVTVEPRGPRAIHVGESGDRIATAYGEHDANQVGSGLEPAEIREYVTGDTADRIDWNATARLGTPHVREFEAETDRKTLFIVDHRAELAMGPAGETKLEYLREVALAMVASARRLGDPVGLLTVGDDGVTSRLEPATTPATYTRVRQGLLGLEPTAEVESTTTATNRHPLKMNGRLTAADARASMAALSGETDTFAATLRPFYATRQGYRDRIESEPLYGAVKTARSRRTDTLWTVIFTDDSRPAELRETVKLARSDGNTVLVLLAPTVLYEPGGLADLESAYDRYLEFEELRRDLSRMSRVTALEVGPTDRLSTVLSTNRSQTRGGRA
ncbi:DUF58 domain-containing protein [Natronorubrum sp. A-ect3]|uniref:DUF58 domain-containing protein n=1 Tax=Natronorubrum sp. A-ect3 TaxID=3242698 RepID=UPI00359EC246